MSVWKGISHGRTTRAMERSLLPAEFKVVATIRRLIPDGERRKISHADIASRARVSEGTVSRTMRKVDGIFFRRHWLGRGRGRGYEIEPIPPPEQLRLPIDAPEKGSLTDPSQESFLSGIETPETPSEKGSLTDPFIFLYHAHEQQQQAGASPTQADSGDSGQADQLTPETIAALDAAGAHPKLIQRVAAANPGCTPADVSAALAGAHAKPTAHTPPGLALECLARRQLVVTPRPPALRPDTPQRPRGRAAPAGDAFDAGQARAYLERQGMPVSPAPDEAPPPPPARASPPPALREAWMAACEILRGKLPRGEFDYWLRPLVLVALADGVATLRAPSADLARTAEQRYGRQIRDALGAFAGEALRVQVIHASPAAD